MNQFELLWNKYPKRVGKKEALYYYNEAIKKGECLDDDYEVSYHNIDFPF